MRITAKQLIDLKKPFIPIDATWYLPNVARNGHQEYLDERLPSALFLDLDDIKSESPYPHMMPTREIFESKVSELGIKPEDTLVFYDKQSLFSSARAYYMFNIFNHKQSLLLDSFAEYKALGGALESGEPTKLAPSNYKVSGEIGKWVQYDEMRSIVQDKDHHILDARPYGRFLGDQPEPRPGMAAGHMPGAKSLPFGDVLESNHIKSDSQIKAALEKLGVLDGKPVVVSCGSGVTACLVKEAIDPFLSQPALVYDGSWGEWGMRAQDLVEKGV